MTTGAGFGGSARTSASKKARTASFAVSTAASIDWNSNIGENSDPAPVYVHVGQSGYHPVSVVVSQPSMYEQALKELNARAKALKDAAASLRSAAFDIDDERAPIIQTAITAVDQASAAIAALR